MGFFIIKFQKYEEHIIVGLTEILTDNIHNNQTNESVGRSFKEIAGRYLSQYEITKPLMNLCKNMKSEDIGGVLKNLCLKLGYSNTHNAPSDHNVCLPNDHPNDIHNNFPNTYSDIIMGSSLGEQKKEKIINN